MTEEDEEFNRIEREAKQRMEAVAATIAVPAPGYCRQCKQYSIEEPLPAAQRAWVGLTADERREAWFFREAQTPTTFAEDIEAKLKEKNGM
jgi:hypothetical protein